MLYYCKQCHRFLQLQKDDNKSKPAIYKLYDFSKGETDIIDQKNGVLQLYIEIKALDYECILIRFEHMSSERQTIYAMNNDLQPQNIKSVDFGFNL